MKRNTLRIEAERLGKLLDSFDAAVARRWTSGARRRLERIVGDGRPPLATERALEQLAWEIRGRHLAEVHARTAQVPKSPPHAHRHCISSGLIEHTYERNLQPTSLEDRLAQAPRIEGWHAHHVVFSSGMASIAAFYQSLLRTTKATPERPVRITNAGAYFETRVLFDLLESALVHTTNVTAGGDIVASPADVLHVETTRYDWDLEPIAVSTLIRAAAAARRLAIVVDTTLCANRFPIATLLAALESRSRVPRPPRLVVQLASGLKLHQQGLELANVGLMTVYVRDDADGRAFGARFVDFLRKMRTILGVCPSLESVAALDAAPFFLDRALTDAHADGVFQANAELARAVPTGGLFERVAHPSRRRRERPRHHVAPFVVFHLREDDLDNHGFLLGVLAFEARRRGLDFNAGSSFGFRGHRYECIVPNTRERRALFKIAMGARPGPSRGGIIALVGELARFASFAALRAAYPNVAGVDMQAVVGERRASRGLPASAA